MKERVIEFLKRYSGKGNVYLTQRGNKSILYSFKIAKSLGKTKLILQDQGGWITYSQYGEKFKFNIIKLKTNFGLIVTFPKGNP